MKEKSQTNTNYKKKKLKVFETFSGIGAQHKAISNINRMTKNLFEVSKISEWDSRAIISYAHIHHNYNINKILNENNIFSEKDLDKWLIDKTFSLNSKKSSKLISKKEEFKRELVAACLVTKNCPNIKEVKGDEIKDIDVLTYSFPCQGLSIANMGRSKGIKKNVDSTSNLIWEIDRILSEAKDKKYELPKFLLLENVKALLSNEHKDDYDEWVNILKNLYGYSTYTYILNSWDFNSPQKRERVFAISIRNQKSNLDYQKIKDIIYKNSKTMLISKSKEWITKNIIDKKNDEKFIEEYEECLIKKTPSREKMVNENKDLSKKDYLNTLTTKQDRHPNIGIVPYKNNKKDYYNFRFITPREGYKIMGFTDVDFDKVRNLWLEKKIVTKESLYRQSGNSIVVNVLEAIFLAIDEITEIENE